MSTSTVKSLEAFHHYCLKKIQFLPVTTRSAMCQNLLGVVSLLTKIDNRKLMFFHKITSLLEGSLSKQIFKEYYIYINTEL